MSELLIVLEELQRDVRALRERIESSILMEAGRSARGPVETDATQPWSAGELILRWKIGSGLLNETHLRHLARKCRRWGLKPLRGGRGWSALYARADVLRAESYAAGQLTKKKGTRA